MQRHTVLARLDQPLIMIFRSSYMPNPSSIVVFFGHGMAVKRFDGAVEEKREASPPNALPITAKVSFTCKIRCGITCEQHNLILDLCIKFAQSSLRLPQTLEELEKAIIPYTQDDINYNHYIYCARDLLIGEGAAKTLTSIDNTRFRALEVEVFKPLISDQQLLEANKKTGKIYCEFNVKQVLGDILIHVQAGHPSPQNLSKECLIFLKLTPPNLPQGTQKLLTEGDRLRYEKKFSGECAEMQCKLKILSKLRIAFAVKHSVEAEVSESAAAATSVAQGSKVALLCPFICDKDDLTIEDKRDFFVDVWGKRKQIKEVREIDTLFEGDFFTGNWEYYEAILAGDTNILWDTCRELEARD